MQLSEEQSKVFESVIRDVRVKRKKQVSYSGAAGTGKTTLLATFANEFPDFAAIVFTGKAARRMQEVGIRHAATIHSTIYKPIIEKGQLLGFDLRDSDEIDCEGFLIDEASTVSESLYTDLMSFGLPCIFVGDHKQLEPIDSGFNLMEKPDYILETIHRNAGDIAHFAEKLSRGESVSGFESDSVTLIEKRDVSDEMLVGVDQIICAYNKTRVSLNERVREAQGRSEDVEVGDRVICLKNRKKLGLFNGMQGIVQEINGNRFTLDCDGVIYPNIHFDPYQFGRETTPQSTYMFGPVPFDWAYCATCWKFQGSEADRVVVWRQNCKHVDMRRFDYTAASRAKKHLTWVM